MNDYVVRSQKTNGATEIINLSQRSRVYSKRKALGLPVFDSESVVHSYVGQNFLFHDELITFVKVVRQWHGGFYYAGLYIGNGDSHGFVYIENINCIEPCILNAIESFKENFSPI